MATDCDFVALV